MFVKMKLRRLILLGYLAPLLLLLGAMTIVFVNLQAASVAAASVQASNQTLGEARDLIYNLTRMQRAARGLLLFNNPTSREAYLDSQRDFKSRIEPLTARVKDPQQQETLRNLLAAGQNLCALDDGFLSLIDAGKQAQAEAQFRSGRGIQESNVLDSLWSQFRQRESEIVNERQASYDSAMALVTNSIVYGVLGATALSVALGLWLAAVISRNITSNAAQLSEAASEIAATIAQHERTANQQATAANETSSTIEELAVSSQRSSEQASNAAVLAEKSGSATGQGGEAIRLAVNAMAELKNQIGAMAEQILHLGEQTGQIGNIAQLVRELSAQINMLALNAAVEAARAGEHGKGFAVVASEVRKLADESKKAAVQTSVLVDDIQKATHSTVIMTDEGTRTVAEVTRLADRVASLFESLSDMASSVNENSQQVMLNAKQQAAAFNQVVEATNSIASGTKETAAGISQTKAGVEKLNQAAENLRAIV